jgi:CPA2 family monovalent cation:H+ antiporter-2
MTHDTSLIHTIVAGLVLAFVFAAIATRLRQPPLVGYLLAGVMVGPYTPGFVADQALVPQLAEIGVILLMFGVGLHFSPRDFQAVRGIAVTGALIQIAFATLLGWGLGALMGWSTAGSLLFGLTLSVASTVVLLKWLQDRHLVETERGRIAVGWLVIEDLAMILALVLIPAAVGTTGGEGREFFVRQASSLLDVPPTIGIIAGVTLLKVAVFIGLMLLVGRRLVPALLHWVAHSGSRELFRLAVLASALGIAYGAAELFGVSFALGAFFAGMVLSESQLSSRAAQESLPLRDAFAVLFFISVGMLFNPAIIIEDPLPVLGTVMIIMFGRSLAVFLVVLAFRHTASTATVIAFSRAQIGEFSFILAGLGVTLGLLPEEGRDLVLAGAMITIVFNPLLLFTAERLRPLIEARLRPPPSAAQAADAQHEAAEAAAEDAADVPAPEADEKADDAEEGADEPSTLSGHTILIGYGGVGQSVGAALEAAGATYLVIDASEGSVAKLRERGVEAFAGNAASADTLELANPAKARCLVVTIADVFEAGQVTQQAREANPAIRIVARAHSEAEADHLDGLGADIVIRAEGELARGMIERLAELPPSGGTKSEGSVTEDPHAEDPDAENRGADDLEAPESGALDDAAPATR